MIRRGLTNDVEDVFLVALVLDSMDQVIVHLVIYAPELHLAATIPIPVPCVAVRGLTTRLAE